MRQSTTISKNSKISKSEIVRAHEKVKDLPEDLVEELPTAYGEIYEAVNRGDFV